MAATKFTTPPPYYFDESLGDSTQVSFVYNNAVYFILPNGVGASGPPPGGTYQLFIQKSTDHGATRTDITPVTPTVDMTGMDFQNFVVAGNILYVLYHPAANINHVAWARFDLLAEAWLSDSAILNNSGVPIEQAAFRASDNVIFCAQHSNNDNFAYFTIYDITADTWSAATQVSTSTAYRNLSIGVDANNLVHVFYREGLLGGLHNLIHLSFNTDNSENTQQTLLAATPNTPGSGNGYPENGQPVFYLDVLPATRKIAIPVVIRSANVSTDIGALNLFIGDESANPTWVGPTLVPTAEPAGVSFTNTIVSATAGPIAALLAVERAAATDLYIFWTTSGVRLVPPGTNFDNFMRWMTYTDGVFSAITTDYSELADQLVPGPIYPRLLAQSGDMATIGVFFPVIDQVQFGSLNTKYTSLSLWFDLPVGAPAPSLVFPNCPGVVGQAYSCTLTASGGTPGYTFSISSGVLPSGLSLDPATGVISGTPTVQGTYAFTAQVTDSLGSTATADCSIVIDPGNVAILSSSGPSVGGMGCVPHCVDPCKDVSQVDRVGGGDPLLLALVLAAGIVVMGEA